MIGIIGAAEIEVELIKELIENRSVKTISGTEYVSGALNGERVVAAACGVGKVAAAVCAQTMILTYSPDWIINTGVAGSLSSELDIGDAAIAESLVQHDMDLSPLGDPVGFIPGLNLVNIPCDPKIVSLLKEGAEALEGTKAVSGVVASGDSFVADASQKKKIIDLFGAVACEMEGASVAQVCRLNKIPFGVVRAISDRADGSSSGDYEKFLYTAAKNASRLAEYFTANVRRIANGGN